MEKVSIIVPVYKVEQFLSRCIESLVVQTYKNIEIILVDDGSPDNCGKICDKYGEKDERIKVIHKKNQGVSKARNCGLDLAIGEYVTFVDSDDYIENTMIEKLVNSIKDNDMAVCGICQKELDGSIINLYGTNKEICYQKEDIISCFFDCSKIKDYMYGPFNKLYKKNIIGEKRFDEKLRMGEDFLFVFNYLRNCKKIVILDECLYHYEKRENSAMTSKFSDKRLDYIQAVRKIEEICKNEYRAVLPKALAWGYIHRVNTYNQIKANVSLEKQYVVAYTELENYLHTHKNYRKYIPLKKKIKMQAKELVLKLKNMKEKICGEAKN